ncbi:hypothetical protein I7X12_07790 [Halosimplex litoreum]|uniref:Uncharacterized protein n=1 Tax=Halosimplex litoreum TaxID=1198301 RepID=A0A7T3G1C7_9EURY|nr:hypothetical protein [Halosimplex litoreum]QPV64502.1 hypothetical protein I7X12_07790 [Halosimplex litoreum]
MTWSVEVEDGEQPVWMVGITDDMLEAAASNAGRDMVIDESRSLSQREREAIRGNLGELVAQELIVQGSDASRWEYEDGFETDLVRDGNLRLDVKTRDLGSGFGALLCRRRFRHKGCGGAITSDGYNRCVECGEYGPDAEREDLHSHMYLLVNIDPGLEFAYVVGLASKQKVEASVWLDWLPDPAHEVRQTELNDASKLLGWA